MAKLTKIDNTDYTQIQNSILADPTLSLKAKGLYSFMYSKPNDWNFTTASMASQLKEDKKTIQRIMRELHEIGLLSYQKHSDGTGTYTLQYKIPEHPQTPINSQSPKMPPRQNASKAKCTPINKTNCSNKKDLSTNPDIKSTTQASKGSDKNPLKKSKIHINLSPEVAQYKRKLQKLNFTGYLGTYFVEKKPEQVYMDSKGHLYTSTRNSHQLLSTTIEEIYKQVFELAQLQNNPNRALFNAPNKF